jgi:Peptidase inhibitor family I36
MRSITKLAIALTGGLALAPSLASAAQAAVPAVHSPRCPQGYVCFWTGPSFSGEMKVYQNPVSHTCDPAPAQPSRTIYNNDDEPWSFYADVQCGAHVVTLSPGEAATDVKVYSWQ